MLGKVTKFGGHSFNRLEVTNLQSRHSSIMFVSAPLSGSIVVSMSFMRIVQVFWMPWLTLWIFRWWMKHSSFDVSLESDFCGSTPGRKVVIREVLLWL